VKNRPNVNKFSTHIHFSQGTIVSGLTHKFHQKHVKLTENALFIFGRIRKMPTKMKFHFRPKNENESHVCLYHRT